jgi:uncharacterized protein
LIMRSHTGCYDRESAARGFYRESVESAMKESEQFRKGVALFNARKYFEAHEVWEELWLVEPEPEKTFLQGLIQVAAACLHDSRGNISGTQSLLAAGLAKLKRFPDDHRGISLAQLRAEAEELGAASGPGNEPGAQKVPRIRFATVARQKKKRGG